MRAHGLDDVVGEQRALVEVDGGFGHRGGDVGVRGEVDDQCRGRPSPPRSALEVVDVALDDGEARVVVVVRRSATRRPEEKLS